MTTMTIKIFELSTIDMTLYKFVLPLMKELRNQDFEVICGAQDLGYLSKIEAEGFSVYPLSIKRNLNPFMLMKSLIELKNIFKREKIDILHVHTPIAGIIGRLAATLAGVPIKIYTVHGFILKPKYYYWIEKIMARYFTTLIFTVNSEDADLAIDNNFIHKDHLSIINGVGINTTYFNPMTVPLNLQKSLKASLNIDSHSIVIGFVGRLVKEKGVLDLINAFNLIENKTQLKLLLVGPSDMDERKNDSIQEDLDNFITQHNLREHVIMTGHREDIRELLSIMDIFVLPSYREGMPVSLLEAMSMETAVIGSDIRGIREEIDTTCGFLYPAGDTVALKKAIISYLEKPHLMQQKRKKARQKVIRIFDESIVIKKQIDIFNTYKNTLE